jgi:hypothetical protein
LAQTKTIEPEDIESALAVWTYCDESTRIIFAGRTGNDAADRILAEMPPGASWTQKQLRERVFSNHIDDGDLDEALELLERRGDVQVRKEATGGRPRIIITRVEAARRKKAAA